MLASWHVQTYFANPGGTPCVRLSSYSSYFPFRCLFFPPALDTLQRHLAKAKISPHSSLSPPPQEDKVNQVLPIGGPGPALSALDQANMLFEITGQKPKYFPVPVALMDGVIGMFDFLARLFPQLEVCVLEGGGGGGRPGFKLKK